MKIFILIFLFFNILPASADLIGAWRFEETTGNVATDSISDHDAIWAPRGSGSPNWTTQGVIGRGVNILGAGDNSDYFKINSLPELNGEIDGMSISVWINTFSNSGYKGILMSRDITDLSNGTTQEGQNYGLGNEGNHFDGRIKAKPVDTIDSNDLTAEGWLHVVQVWDNVAGTQRIYVNGVQSGGTKSLPANIVILSNNDWRIGDDACCGNRNFNGLLDDLTVWNEALSQEDVNSIYQDGLVGIPAMPFDRTPVGPVIPETAPLNVGLVINEIHYDADPKTNFVEFIELLNTNETDLAVGGYTFADGIIFEFPQGTVIPATGYVILAENPADLATVFPGIPEETQVFQYQGSLAGDGETVVLENGLGGVIDRVKYRDEFPWPISADGEGDSMQLLNATIDNDLGAAWRGAAPTPGYQNTVFADNAPPLIRQVSHSPKMPSAVQSTLITAKISDSEGVSAVSLSYQVVAPGEYISAFFPLPEGVIQEDPTRPRTANPAFEDPANWTVIPMTDDGSNGDVTGNDSIFTAVIPPQAHRTLMRYRITASDTLSEEVRVPYADDPSLNFAYFVYDGVPDYVANIESVHPEGAGHVYPSSLLTSLPVYHFLTDPDDLVQCWAYNEFDEVNSVAARKAYNWEGAMVYEGVVYDHISYRLRQKNDRYVGQGRRSMKFRFRKGNYFAARNPDGELYDFKWRTMNTSKMSRFRTGTNYGLRERISSRLWNRAGVIAPEFQHVHFRVIDDLEEAPDQYRGDFYGMALIFEDTDSQFVKQRNLPRGNIYKLKDGTSDPRDLQKFQSRTAVTNASDFINIRDNLGPPTQSDQWLRDHVAWDKWYLYAALGEGFRHYDFSPSFQKNRIWYFEPSPDNPLGKMSIIPHDIDGTWIRGVNDGMWNDPRYKGGTRPDGSTFRGRVVGIDLPKEAIQEITGLDGTDGENHPEREAFMLEYRNVIREVYDVFWDRTMVHGTMDEIYTQIAAFTLADRDRWDKGPDEVGNENMTPIEAILDPIKELAFTEDVYFGSSLSGGRKERLRTLAIDPKIPVTPTITNAGSVDFQPGSITVSSSDFNDPDGNGTFAAMEWRVAQVPPPVDTPTPLIETGHSWSYFDLGTNPGEDWFSESFNDSAWPVGTSELGYGDGDEATVVNFIDFNPAASGTQKNPATFFRTTINISDLTAAPSYLGRIKFDDGTVVYINGLEIFRSRVPSDSPAFETYAIGMNNENSYTSFGIPPGILRRGLNTIAVSVHQTSGSSSDISFDLRLSGANPALSADIVEWDASWESGESPSFQRSVTLPASATRTGLIYRARVRHQDNTGRWSHWSEPLEFVAGEVNVMPYLDSLVISEVMYHPPEATQAERDMGFIDDDEFEFIEIRNVSPLPISLDDVRFTKGVDFDFVDGDILTLDPGAFAVVVRNREAFEFRYGTERPVAGIFTGKLNNSSDRIKLSFGAGNTIREFTYLDQFPWPTATDGIGYSLNLINPRSFPDHANSRSWRAGDFLGGRPGDIDGDLYTGNSAEEIAAYAFDSQGGQMTGGVDGLLNFEIGLRQNSDNLEFILEASSDLTNWNIPVDFLSESATAPIDQVYSKLTFSGIRPAGLKQVFLRYRVEKIE